MALLYFSKRFAEKIWPAAGVKIKKLACHIFKMYTNFTALSLGIQEKLFYFVTNLEMFPIQILHIVARILKMISTAKDRATFDGNAQKVQVKEGEDQEECKKWSKW